LFADLGFALNDVLRPEAVFPAGFFNGKDHAPKFAPQTHNPPAYCAGIVNELLSVSVDLDAIDALLPGNVENTVESRPKVLSVGASAFVTLLREHDVVGKLMYRGEHKERFILFTLAIRKVLVVDDDLFRQRLVEAVDSLPFLPGEHHRVLYG
jgi:hypothetical protein